MKNPDYLIMCSKCEVRIHTDDYNKHKVSCQQPANYIPMPYPVYPQPYDYHRTYPFWEWRPYEGATYTRTTHTPNTITYGRSSCDAGETLIS